MKRTLLVIGLISLVAITSALAATPRRSSNRYRAAVDVIAGAPLPAPGLQPKTYQGTKVKPHPDAQGDALTLQQEIARKFAQVDPQPSQRKTRFAWLDKPVFGLRGWGGQITGVTPTPNGLVVKVTMTPIVVSAYGASTTILDHTKETYLYSGGRLHLLDSDPNPGPSSGSFITD